MQAASTLGLSRNLMSAYHSNIAVQPSLSRKLLAQPSFLRTHLRANLPSPKRAFSIDAQLGSPPKIRKGALSLVYKAAGVAGVGIGLSVLTVPTIFCEPAVETVSPHPASGHAAPSQRPEAVPPPPSSSVNYLELTFGTVTGICAGVFVKKGAKLVAFVLGGAFVLLQYLGSLSLIRVDWSRTSSRFEKLFYRKGPSGEKRAPTVGSFFRWIIDFLTADFQQRATFTAGFVLGLRIG